MNENQQFTCVWDALEDTPQEAADDLLAWVPQALGR